MEVAAQLRRSGSGSGAAASPRVVEPLPCCCADDDDAFGPIFLLGGIYLSRHPPLLSPWILRVKNLVHFRQATATGLRHLPF